MTSGIVQIRPSPHANSPLVPFRIREVGGYILLTSYFGDFVFLSKGELDVLTHGTLDPNSDLFSRLQQANFLRDGLDRESLAKREQNKLKFTNFGPNLHIVIPTLRCNQTCVYCHASRADMSATETDMTTETADKVVDFIFQTTSPSITIEFQGGEPLANFPLVKYVIEQAKEKNQTIGKVLEFTLVSNLTLLDDEKLDYLVQNKVQICTSIDGPAPLHDRQRILVGASSHQLATHWIKKINERYVTMGLDPVLYHVEALLTTTREALQFPQEIVDTYVQLGCRAIFLRPLDPFGFAKQTAQSIEYDRNAFLDYYKSAVDHILQINRQGIQVLERFAAIFLTKILAKEEPNFLDIRSPCGAGIGQLAYNYDGSIFTCDEGRMVHQMGDPFFRLGNVADSKYRALMLHDTVESMTLASNLSAQPDCVNCTYQPYCGVCPVHNYATQGSIFGRMRESSLCAAYKGIQDFLFDKLRTADDPTLEILRRWTTIRERSHFIQACATP